MHLLSNITDQCLSQAQIWYLTIHRGKGMILGLFWKVDYTPCTQTEYKQFTFYTSNNDMLTLMS